MLTRNRYGPFVVDSAVRTFAIQDAIHLDEAGAYRSLDAAIAQLKRLARTPWDSPPNRPPCASWEGCGRDWEILEVAHDEGIPWRLVQTIPAVAVSRYAVTWASPFRATKPFARRPPRQRRERNLGPG